MAQQRRTPSLDRQLSEMINELYNNEMMAQTGTFVPMAQPSPPMELLGTAAAAAAGATTTTRRLPPMSLPVSTFSSPASSYKQQRTTKVAAAIHQKEYYDDDDDNNSSTASTVRRKYKCRTLGEHNFVRLAILPIFPTITVKIETKPTSDECPTTSMITSGKIAHVLLSNVPIESLGNEEYARLRRGTFPQKFRMEIMGTADMNINDSFLLKFYEDFYIHLKKRLRVDISLLDFNLARLRVCIDQVVVQRTLEQTMLNMDELAVALEFYLQIDVDMFFLKTCSFNGAQPRLFEQRFTEGLFCLDTPIARYMITPCDKPSCLCCHSPCPRRYVTGSQAQAAIQFSVPYIHRFVNQYEAILNCPATCESKNCIYVLTCPCGQFEFIGESKVSFAETLAMHREEGNRIIREFLIGEHNIEHTTRGLKSEKKKANDQLWLYQHAARCPAALQLFLDYNPEFWCFVPMKTVELQLRQGPVRGYLAPSPMAHREATTSESDMSTSWTRKDAEVRFLVQNVPRPPLGYDFNNYQRQQQANFFKWTQDRNVPLNNVDVYNANIIAVLPNNASKLFRKLIESLLITHADCKLNQTGHLLPSLQSNVNPNRALEGTWCVNLTRRPLITSPLPF